MNHVASVGQSNSIAATEGLHNRPCPIVSIMASPIALKLEQNLQPRRHSRPGGFHSPQCKFMARRGYAAARVGHDEYLITFSECRKHRERDTGLCEQPRHQ